MPIQISPSAGSPLIISGGFDIIGEPNYRGIPSNLQGTITASNPQTTNCTVSFNITSVDEGLLPVQGYEIVCNASSGTVPPSNVIATSSSTFQFEGLTSLKTYTFTVYAYSRLGRSRASLTSNPVTTGAPMFPTGAIILYNGTDPSNIAWPRYSAVDNLYVQGTATQALIGTTSTPTTSLSHTYSLSTTGGHSVSSGYNFPSSANAGAISAIPANPAGDHSHGLTMTGSGSAAKPYTTEATFLRAASNQVMTPPNSIHINADNKNSWTQKIATTAGRYFRGGTSGFVDVAPVTMTVSGTTDTSGSHGHVLGGQRSSSSTGSGVYNPADGTGQDHTHSVTGTATITGMRGKLMKMWVAASAEGLYANNIVMYDGTLASLPAYWKVCDGTNGTADLTSYFLGYSTSASHHELVTANSVSVSSGGASGSWIHTHASVTSTGISTIVLTTGHGSQSQSHNHTVTLSSGTTSHDPGTYRVAFIQFTG
jgi:hypothetical protein